MADEARSMLDALMGGDRNAPLPSGAAVQKGITSTLSKKTKSRAMMPTFVPSIVPGMVLMSMNSLSIPKVTLVAIQNSYRKVPIEEFQQLPKHEQERLGFHYLLFRKLQDLVRMCDRTVARNKEKLVQEKRGKGTAHIDYVTTVDERAVEQACRTRIDLDKITNEIHEKECELNKVMEQEAKLQEQYQKQELLKRRVLVIRMMMVKQMLAWVQQVMKRRMQEAKQSPRMMKRKKFPTKMVMRKTLECRGIFQGGQEGRRTNADATATNDDQARGGFYSTTSNNNNKRNKMMKSLH